MKNKHRAIYYSICGALIAVSLVGIGYSSYVLVTASSQSVGVNVTASEVIANDGMIHGGNQSLSVKKKLQFTKYGFVGDDDITSAASVGTMQLNVPINLSKTATDDDGNYTIDIVLGYSAYNSSGTDVTDSAPNLVQYVSKIGVYSSMDSTVTYYETGDGDITENTTDSTISVTGAVLSGLSGSGTISTIYFGFEFTYSAGTDDEGNATDFNTDVYSPFTTYVTTSGTYNFTLNWQQDS